MSRITFSGNHPKHRFIEFNGAKVGELYKSGHDLKNPWIVEVGGKRMKEHGYDCFTLNIAKRVAKSHLLKLT